MNERVLFQILGPLRAEFRGTPLDLGGSRARLVLAALLLEPDRIVPVDRLVDTVWDARPPSSARTQVAIAVSRLRRAFREVGHPGQVIETSRPGYRLPLGAAGVDALDAERRVLEAREAVRAGRLEEGAEGLRAALALWNGPVLGGMDGALIRAGALRWEELRLSAIEEAAEVGLALGRHHELIGELMKPVAAHPFRERLRAMLMLALARASRQSEALGVYRDGRRILAEEMGLEPGRELRELHEAILRDDPAVSARPVVTRPIRGRRCAGAVARSRSCGTRSHGRRGRRH